MSADLGTYGISDSEIARLLASLQQERTPLETRRGDLPVVQEFGRRASFTLALVAAQPNNRKRHQQTVTFIYRQWQ